jgi:hypothetical protein
MPELEERRKISVFSDNKVCSLFKTLRSTRASSSRLPGISFIAFEAGDSNFC